MYNRIATPDVLIELVERVAAKVLEVLLDFDLDIVAMVGGTMSENDRAPNPAKAPGRNQTFRTVVLGQGFACR
jgi:hypothetical protein